MADIKVGDEQIILDDSRVAEKVDDNNVKIIITIKQNMEKTHLLEDRQRLQSEVTRLQAEINEIDQLLDLLK